MKFKAGDYVMAGNGSPYRVVLVHPEVFALHDPSCHLIDVIPLHLPDLRYSFLRECDFQKIPDDEVVQLVLDRVIR